ncbi:hypothetical protein [Nocardia sp. CC227C]|uniref:hypothetical protein n=1 Tax=Nocardia sp. CC227C TaxID=3044562 RepID=UPI00278BC495|nr:hypothetical protein [Nocardia sp. CC227C]
MTPAEFVAEQSSRIGWLKECLAETKELAVGERLTAEIAQAQARLDDFLDFANGIYWPTDETQRQA